MGLFSKIFGGGIKKGVVHSGKDSQWTYANRFNKAKGGHAGGYGAVTFKNIVNAHSSEGEIVEEFLLDAEVCVYIHPRFGMNCYNKAWLDEYERAQIEAAALMAASGGLVEIDPEELMDMEQVEEDAYEYALELAYMYIEGDIWIPGVMLNWAYYDVSTHNW